jgi:hypothetical protein
MTWFYEIRDSNHVVASTGKGFETDKAAMAAGRKKSKRIESFRLVAGRRIRDRESRARFRSDGSQ